LLLLKWKRKEKEMKQEEKKARRYVGIDLAKRSMEVCILDGKGIERHSYKTDEIGRGKLRRILRGSDVVGMETCCCSTMLTREVVKEVGSQVYNLNAGALRIIWESRKKTDKEDSLKIAKYVRDTAEEEMVLVPLPSEEEEELRNEISLRTYLKEERTAAVNRLHSLYARMGIIDVAKKDLEEACKREAQRGKLPEKLRREAELLEQQLELFEKQLTEVEGKIDERVRKDALTPYLLSIPGIGLRLAAAILAYIGDGKRFGKGSQVANYAGLTPRVDCSGETKHYGSIARHQYCKAIRSIVLESVWALTRS
jgi:transposase